VQQAQAELTYQLCNMLSQLDVDASIGKAQLLQLEGRAFMALLQCFCIAVALKATRRKLVVCKSNFAFGDFV
jgi:hypothetical protein